MSKFELVGFVKRGGFMNYFYVFRTTCENQKSMVNVCKITFMVVFFSSISIACHAQTNRSGFAGFQGQSPDWVGDCSAEMDISKPSNGISNGTLTVTCNNTANVEEFFVGYFSPSNDGYSANVTAIKNFTGLDYDEDMHLELQLSQDGCTMSGTDTGDGDANNVSFISNSPDCQ